MINLKIKNNNSLSRKGRESQSGRSMIEMLGVLAIIGVLSVGGIAGYSKAMQKYRINKAIEQITLIAGNIRTFFASQGNYDGLSCQCTSDGSSSNCHGKISNDGCPVIKKAKILPDEMLEYYTSGTYKGNIKNIINPFGHKIELSPITKSQIGDDRAFYIDYHIGDNIEACIDLITQDWTELNIGIIFISNPELYLKTPISVDLAIEKCSNSVQYLTFYFDVDVNSAFWQNALNQTE